MHSGHSLGFKTRVGVCVSSWASRQRGPHGRCQLYPRKERSAASLLGARPRLPLALPQPASLIWVIKGFMDREHKKPETWETAPRFLSEVEFPLLGALS